MTIEYKDIDKQLSYLVYRPPKSNSHGHAVRSKNIITVLRKTVGAFQENLGAKLSVFNNMKVILYYDREDQKEQSKLENTISILNGLLGLPIREWQNPGYPYQKDNVEWESRDKSMFDVLEYIEHRKENILPISQWWIHDSYHYGNKNTPMGHIMCSIESGRLFVRLHLVFPYSINDDRLFPLVSNLSHDLPFKLNPNHFRLLGPSKHGYGQWKLDDEFIKRLQTILK